MNWLRCSLAKSSSSRRASSSTSDSECSRIRRSISPTSSANTLVDSVRNTVRNTSSFMTKTYPANHSTKALTVSSRGQDSVTKSYRTQNSSGDEIANVNFLYDDIVHTVQNTINSWINSAIDRRGYVLEHRFTKFSEITQCYRHYAVQGHSRSPILVPIESSYN